MMNWLQKVVANIIGKAVEEQAHSPAITAKVQKAHRDSIRRTDPTKKLTSTGFIWVMALEYWDNAVRPWPECSRLGLETLREYLKDQNIRFGADGYSWTAEDAKDLAHSYEIEHWETK